MSAAAAEFCVPKSTLYGQTSGMHKRVGSGAPTVLSHHDEQEMVLTCQVPAEMGFGVTRKLVEVVVADYVQENNILTPFTDGKPAGGNVSRNGSQHYQNENRNT